MKYAGEKDAIVIIDALFDDNLDPSIRVMERIMERNLLYYIGEQHLQWDSVQRIFQAKGGRRKKRPRPTANIIRDYVRSMKAMILNKEYTFRVWPNSEDLEDKEAALLAEEFVEYLDSINDEEFEDIKEWLAVWTVLFGTAFARTYPAMESGEWNITKDGLLTTGEVGTECVLPFNVRLDVYGDTLNRKRFVGVKSLKPREWVEDTFKEKISASDDIQMIDYQKRLMKLVSSVSPWKGAGIDIGDFDIEQEDMVVFKEAECKPTKKYTDGRYICAVGNKILLDQKSMPIPAEKGRFHYTLTDFHYHNVPGRFWSDGGINDLISPQDSINSIDSALEMNRKGLGRPIVMMPADITLKRLNEFGQSLVVLQYDALLSGGAKPEIDRGQALPAQVLEERKNHMQTAQDAGGDPKNVLRGKTPSSQASGVLVGILREAAEQGHTPDITRYFRSLKRVYTKRLILGKKIYSEERTIKIAGKGNELRIKQFKGSDIRNNTDLRLEVTSKASVTHSGQTQMMSEMAKSGAFGDLSEQPDVRNELMQRVGLSSYKDRTNIHIEYTERENAMIAGATEDDILVVPGTPGPRGELSLIPVLDGLYAIDGEDRVSDDPTFKTQNHVICMEYHLKFILSPEFKALREELQRIAISHYDAHNMAQKMKEAEVMEQQAAMQERSATSPAPASKPPSAVATSPQRPTAVTG